MIYEIIMTTVICFILVAICFLFRMDQNETFKCARKEIKEVQELKRKIKAAFLFDVYDNPILPGYWVVG